MKFTKAFSSIFTILLIAAIIYALVNLIHLSWNIVDPEGFWGFFYFIGVFGVILVGIVVTIATLGILIYGIITLFSNFPNNFSLKNILRPLGLSLIVIVFAFINTITGSGISMYINKKIADRYSYINESEKLFSEGKYAKALEYSKKAYKKYGFVPAPSKFFILSWLFYNSNYGFRTTLTKQYATIINYAFCLSQNRESLDLAEKLYKEALTISDTKLLRNDEGYKIFPCLSLADLYLNKGDYSEADRYFRQLLLISNQSSKDDIEYVCMSQETFASYSLQIGDFNRARILRESNVKLWEEKKQSKKSLQYLVLLLSATSSEIITGNFYEAGNYLAKAKPLAQKRKEKAVYSAFLNMKGIYCNYISLNGKGNEEIIEESWSKKLFSFFKKEIPIGERFKSEAEACFLEVLKIEKNANGEKSIGYAQALHRLGSFYIEQGNKLRANELLKEAVQICEQFKTTDINSYYSILLAFTISEFSLKGYDSTRNYIDELENYHFGRLIANYSFLTEKERESYKNLVDNAISSINSTYIATNSSETRQRLFNNVIATKEIALYANEHIRQNLLMLNDSLQREYFSIIKQRDSIENLKGHLSPDEEKLAYDIRLKEKAVQVKINSLPGFTQFDPRVIKWKNIEEALKDREAAIEFIHSKIGKSEKYFALVTKKGQSAPELIPLFEEATLKSILNQPGNSREMVNAIYGKWKDSLYTLVWKPLEEELINIDRVYISVSGILYSISFPAIMDEKNVDVVLLGSTRQIAIMKNGLKSQYHFAALFGGVNYGQNEQNGGQRSNYSSLPFTIQEVREIYKILSAKQPKIKLDSITNSLATEAKFRSLERLKPDLIHLATHGYYYPGSDFTSSDLLSETQPISNLNPMLNSGIVLAGANHRLKSDIDNDGFLSAQEIARMNLSNLDLAVLSACETGLGEIIGSEGVFGLQRGFKLAGAKSIIMSLWKVPDEQTTELMRLFYTNYMNGMTKSRALKEAQQSLRKLYNDPFFWGGFILLEQ